MSPFNRERGKPSEPDRTMWWFALLICREADATSRARNLTVIGAVVAGAFARILAPVVLGLGLEFVLQSAWWRWGLPVVGGDLVAGKCGPDLFPADLRPPGTGHAVPFHGSCPGPQ